MEFQSFRSLCSSFLTWCYRKKKSYSLALKQSPTSESRYILISSMNQVPHALADKICTLYRVYLCIRTEYPQPRLSEDFWNHFWKQLRGAEAYTPHWCHLPITPETSAFHRACHTVPPLPSCTTPSPRLTASSLSSQGINQDLKDWQRMTKGKSTMY